MDLEQLNELTLMRTERKELQAMSWDEVINDFAETKVIWSQIWINGEIFVTFVL